MDQIVVDLLTNAIDKVDKKVDSIDEKVDQMLQFKWQIVGGSVVISAVASVIISLIIAVYSR